MIDLKLEINEVNLVLGALGQMPYVQSFELIEKIKVQAKEQIEDKPE